MFIISHSQQKVHVTVQIRFKKEGISKPCIKYWMTSANMPLSSFYLMFSNIFQCSGLKCFECTYDSTKPESEVCRNGSTIPRTSQYTRDNCLSCTYICTDGKINNKTPSKLGFEWLSLPAMAMLLLSKGYGITDDTPKYLKGNLVNNTAGYPKDPRILVV